MPTTVSNPRDLYLVLLCDILFVERRLAVDVLPELIESVRDPELSAALGEHLEQTREHAARLEPAFRAVGAEPTATSSRPFVALAEQHAAQAASIVNATLADAWHAAAAAHTEHYEIAAYAALIPLAGALGATDAADGLAATLEEERLALSRLEHAHDRLARR